MLSIGSFGMCGGQMSEITSAPLSTLPFACWVFFNLLSSPNCLKKLFHISRTLSECQTIRIHSMTDVLLVLICTLTANVISRRHFDIHIWYGSKVFAKVSTCSRRQMSLLACKQLNMWIVLKVVSGEIVLC